MAPVASSAANPGDGSGGSTGALQSEAPLVSALLEHIERPVALCNPAGELVAMNSLFLHEAEQLGLSPADFSLAAADLGNAAVAAPRLALIRSDLGVAAGLAPDWQLLELPGRVVSLATLARIFDNRPLASGAILQVELFHPAGLLRQLGPNGNDALLDALERRLLASLPIGATLCRSAEQRLLALIPGRFEQAELNALARCWQQQWSAPLQLDQLMLNPRLSLALCRFPEDGERFDLLLEASSRALLHTGSQAMAEACIATPLDQPLPDQHHLAGSLALAIDRQQLNLLYQPIVQMATGRLEGVEVLCRWRDPQVGAISPGEFIAVAEATAQINLLGTWLVEAVFRQIRSWRERQLPIDYVSINISPLQLHDDALLETLQRSLRRHGLSASGIMLEMTENRDFETSAQLRRRLWTLSELGFTLAMDDYGTGYSSLQRLTSLPFRALKVDRCLIDAIETDPLQQAMLKGVVELQHSTGLRVVIEGVERQGQRSRLLQLGCRVGQGFLFSRPVTAEELESLLHSPTWAAERQA